MKKNKSLLLLLISFFVINAQQVDIAIVYKSKPFWFRFPPKLKTIKGRKIISAKMNYEHPELGSCSYEVVKDLKRNKFFAWCNSKKISRRKTEIFEIDLPFKKLPDSHWHVEIGLNEYMQQIIDKINNKHLEIK